MNFLLCIRDQSVKYHWPFINELIYVERGLIVSAKDINPDKNYCKHHSNLTFLADDDTKSFYRQSRSRSDCTEHAV